MSKMSIISLVRPYSLMGDVMSRTEDYRLQVVISAAELKAVDTFRFEKRLPSRTAAVRELLRLGLTSRSAKEHHQK
jgi:metal-responsive CopG/Arc/MetJ family transcriptional regulator